MIRMLSLIGSVALASGFFASLATAQQVVVETPFHNVGSSFSENMGVGFGFQLRGARNMPSDDGGHSAVVGLSPQGVPGGNLVFRQNLGGGRSHGGGQGGFGVRGSGGGFDLNFNLGQGSSRSFHSQTPSVTLTNGYPGSFQHGTIRPFVTGLVPVVGIWPNGHPSRIIGPKYRVSPIASRIQRYQRGAASGLENAGLSNADRGNTNYHEPTEPPTEGMRVENRLHTARGSSAGHGDLSLAAIHAQHAAEKRALQEEITHLIEQGDRAEAEGKPGVARIYFQQAARKAEGELQEQLLQRIQKLSEN